jgi:hypothetical protein
MRAPTMNRRQVAEAVDMRARGLTWQQIANHFGLTSSQVRHYTGALKKRVPSPNAGRRGRKPTGRKPPPLPGTEEHDRIRKLSRERQRAYRQKISAVTGMSYPLYRELLTSAVEHAALTKTPIDEVRLKFGVPSPRQLEQIRQRLQLPTPNAAMEMVTNELAVVLDGLRPPRRPEVQGQHAGGCGPDRPRGGGAPDGLQRPSQGRAGHAGAP